MIISVYSPFSNNTGVTTTSILVAMGLAEKKRPVFLTHASRISHSFDTFLGIEEYEDKTTTATQLVKLMQEGAITIEELKDYMKHPVGFLDVFTNKTQGFTQIEMNNLIKYVVENTGTYEYTIFDIDKEIKDETSKYIMDNTDIVVMVVPPDVVKLQKIKAMERELKFRFRNKQIVVVSASHTNKAIKTKQIAKELGFKTDVLPIYQNDWVKWANNRGKLPFVFLQGTQGDGDVLEVYKSVQMVVKAIGKARQTITRQKAKRDGEKNL